MWIYSVTSDWNRADLTFEDHLFLMSSIVSLPLLVVSDVMSDFKRILTHLSGLKKNKRKKLLVKSLNTSIHKVEQKCIRGYFYTV